MEVLISPKLVVDLIKLQSGKANRIPANWTISGKGYNLMPPNTTMRVWINTVEYVVPFCVGYFAVIRAVGRFINSDGVLIIDYVVNQKSRCVIVAKKGRKKY